MKLLAGGSKFLITLSSLVFLLLGFSQVSQACGFFHTMGGCGTCPVVNGTYVSSLKMIDNTFVPGVIIINAGDRLSWYNHDECAHTVTSDDGLFDSGSIGPGERYRHVFTTPGRYYYHSAFNPGMTGLVIVRGNCAE
jgi:plastocyanin